MCVVVHSCHVCRHVANQCCDVLDPHGDVLDPHGYNNPTCLRCDLFGHLGPRNKVLNRRVDLWQLVHNEWVRLVTRDPDTGEFYRPKDGRFVRMGEPTFDPNAAAAAAAALMSSVYGGGRGSSGSNGGDQRSTRTLGLPSYRKQREHGMKVVAFEKQV